MRRVFLAICLLYLSTEASAWRRRRRAPSPCSAVNCQVGSWTSWSSCSHQCGTSGTQTRTRQLLQAASCGGTCPYNLRETRACNRDNCRNGGTPDSGGCSCRAGYGGTCCEQASLLMPSSASTAVTSSASLAPGISLTTTVAVTPSPSSPLMLTAARTQVTSSTPVMVSPSNTQTSSVSPSAISVSSSTIFVSPAGKPGSSTNLITPTSSSLGVSASASPGANPCGKNNGGCAHYCVRYGSEYNCSCSTGFQLENDLHNCSDIDECSSTPGGHKCAHICVNTVGSFACACRTEYRLENDGLACKQVPKTSPTAKDTSDDVEWDWTVLGIVIGAVTFAIIFLILGIIVKKVFGNQRKENITSQEMAVVKTTSSMAATNPVAIES